jgi:hypothetical protein
MWSFPGARRLVAIRAPEDEVTSILKKEAVLDGRKLNDPKKHGLEQEIEFLHEQKLCGHSCAHSLDAVNHTILLKCDKEQAH